MENDVLRQQVATKAVLDISIPKAALAAPPVEISRAGTPAESEHIVHQIDDLDLPAFLKVAAGFGAQRYGYVVTPNVDHLIRCHEDPSYHSLYRSATYVLLDSRFAAHLLRVFKGLRLPVCPGSDVFPALLDQVVSPSDRLVLIGGSTQQAETLARTHGLEDLRHHNPPMGFINDPVAVRECLEFIEAASPFRFCFLAVGAPQQERIAHMLMERGRAAGLALCFGASLNFVTGVEKRAPAWMRRIGSEWLYRLIQDPKRLGRRYLIRGPRIFGHLRRARIVLRPTATA
ncbi:MAG TPA: WecB/TagA/CpsF family glycosyltransferase [Steroidobacteraceae bacterium]|nr:WecB/TagA/CpsF family glycosyltransferase [Steroidobacteraceae bacterium]